VDVGRPLPRVLGIAADLGLGLSLVLVLIGWGTIGTIAGIALGIVSLSGVITTVVLQLAGRDWGPRKLAGRPAYVFIEAMSGERDRRAA
jgi:hypothetical protein